MRHPTRRAVLAAGAAATLLPRRGWAQAKKPIRIGVLTDMGGTYSAITGPGSVLASQMAIEDFTKANPGIAVELISADLQLKPDVAISIAGDWFDNKGVDLLMDVPLSSAAIAIGEMAKARDKLAIYTGAASAVLTGPRCGPNHLHWSYDTWSIPHSIVETTVKAGGDTWYFINADYTYGHTLQQDSAAFVKRAGGKVLGNAAYPFPGTTDFSAFLLQAKASGTKVIGLANGGTDAINCIKQAAEFGIPQSGIKVVGVGLLINDIYTVGLDAAKGVLLAEPYYWNLDDGTRAFGRRFAERMTGHPMPNSAQAGQYSAITHYLKAVAAMGVDKSQASGRATIAQMKAIPIVDPIFRNGAIRDDGRVIHDIHMFEAKSPAASKEPWDLVDLKLTIPAPQAFRPLAEGNCPMIRA